MSPKDQGPDYGAWMERYGPALRQFFRSRISEDDVDDLVLDVFVRIQAAQPDEPVENVRSYLFTAAHHVLANQYRDQATRAALLRDEFPDDTEIIDLISPERIAIAIEDFEYVIDIISHLPPRTREAFELSRFENLTYPAIANRMGITPHSVRDLMNRASDRIHNALKARR